MSNMDMNREVAYRAVCGSNCLTFNVSGSSYQVSDKRQTALPWHNHTITQSHNHTMTQ